MNKCGLLNKLDKTDKNHLCFININFAITVLFFFQFSNAQIGIGTTLPDETAILELKSTEKGFLPPRLTAEQRNNIENPAEGLMIYNLDTKEINFYNGVEWIGQNTSQFAFAEGGSITHFEEDNKYFRVHRYEEPGEYQFNLTHGGGIKFLILGGGGAGGGASSGANRGHGGGGSGGLITNHFLPTLNYLSAGEYTVIVGAGGLGNFGDGGSGENSMFLNLVAFGGGGGTENVGDGTAGGSGAGANRLGIGGTSLQINDPSTNFGNTGGDADCDIFDRNSGGGGGGTSTAGQNAFCNNAGDGGNAMEINFTGEVEYFGAGGGGGTRGSGPGNGGIGGGGNGAQGNNQGSNASGYGSGGGGAGNTRFNSLKGGNGSNGIVIIKYEISEEVYNSITGDEN